jgi:ligand-binding SRPBCC domain-containing protein
MTVTVCPAATINAPIERVWSLLMDPRRWTDWSTARLEAAKPDGPLHAGQRLYFSSRAFGRRWHAVTTVTSVAVERHNLDVDVSAPFGIVNHEHLSLVSLPDRRTHVQFG